MYDPTDVLPDLKDMSGNDKSKKQNFNMRKELNKKKKKKFNMIFDKEGNKQP